MTLHRHLRLAAAAAFTLALLTAGAWAADTPPEGLTAADWAHLRGLMDQAAYEVEPAKGSFQAGNHKHRIRTVFDRDGIRVLPADSQQTWNLELQLTAYGYAGALLEPGQAELIAEGARMEYRRGDLVEWYINDGRGLEQGFTLAERPAERPGARQGRLRVEMQVSGSLAPQWRKGADSLAFVSGDGRTSLDYGGLIAWDADGVRLPASLEVENDRIALLVDDEQARYPLTIDPTIVNETAKLTGSDTSSNAQLGSSVAWSDDVLVVGAPGQYCAESADCGAVYVFEKPEGGWTNAHQVARLAASTGALFDWLGASVAISGDTIVAGALGRSCTTGRNCGAVYVFEKPAGGWTNANEDARLVASDRSANDYLGGYVGIDGDTIVAGAYGDSCPGGTSCGAVYIFEKPVGGWTNGSETVKLPRADYSYNLGAPVAISGDIVIAGSPGDARGTLRVYEKGDKGWSNATPTATLATSDGGRLRDKAAISGDTVVAGAYFERCEAGSECGALYVFERPAGGWADVTETAKLTASNPVRRHTLGYSVAISGNIIAAGAPGEPCDEGPACGAAYLFEKPAGGWVNANETAKLIASDRAKGDGYHGTLPASMGVAILGDTVAMGSPFANNCNEGGHCGAAYVFEVTLQAPTITTSGVIVQQDSAAANQLVATVEDSQDLAKNLEVTLESDNPLNDVTVSNLSVDWDGAVTADVAAGCLASDAAFTLRVTDSDDRTDDGLLEVTVTPETTAPVASVGVGLASLWPNNKSFLDVGLSGGATDNCDDAPDVQVAVYSNEDDEAVDAGEAVYSPDAAAVGDSLVLRAERQGSGQGRVYLIVVTATDLAGNQDVAATTIVVPKSNAPKWRSAADALAQAAEAYALANDGAPPPGYALIGDGPVIGPKQP